MATTFIYFLRDPTNPMKGYVGKAYNPKRRLTEHYRDRNREYYNARWINSLVKRGLRPKLEILDEVPRDEGSPWEAAYIEYFLELGYALTNATLGGEGGPGLAGEKHPMFGKKGALHPCFGKASSLRGIPHTPEVVARIVAWHTGKKRGPEARSRMRVKKEGSSSKFHGVCFSKREGKWSANISAHDKKLFLGYFSEEMEAAKAHDLAAKIHHGIHAVLNFS